MGIGVGAEGWVVTGVGTAVGIGVGAAVGKGVGVGAALTFIGILG